MVIVIDTMVYTGTGNIRCLQHVTLTSIHSHIQLHRAQARSFTRLHHVRMYKSPIAFGTHAIAPKYYGLYVIVPIKHELSTSESSNPV